MPPASHPPTPVGGEGRPIGRRGFESGSDVYERARPGYPDEAVDRLVAVTGLGGTASGGAAPATAGPTGRSGPLGPLALDVAAGTGKLTRALTARRVACTAVEPSPSMRTVFRYVVPGVPVLAGTAEALPFASGSVHTVAVAQAFHWFDLPRALPEIVRVLRPGGWLAVIRNERDPSDPLVAELVRRSRWRPGHLGAERDFGADIAGSGLFGPVRHAAFPFLQRLDLDTFVDQVASRSYVRVLDEPERRRLLGSVRDLGASVGGTIPLPYTTDLYCAPALAVGA